MSEEHPARLASQRSMRAVEEKDREGWLALYADDAVIEDPVGPSPLDPGGRGQRGKEAIARFWDRHIAPNTIRFEISQSYAAGSEVANVGRIFTTMPNGVKAVAEGVFVYRVDETGRIVSLRAFWELERMLATMG